MILESPVEYLIFTKHQDYHKLKQSELTVYDEEQNLNVLNERLSYAPSFEITLLINKKNSLSFSGKRGDRGNKKEDMTLSQVFYGKKEVYGGYTQEVFFGMNENNFFVLLTIFKEGTKPEKCRLTISKNKSVLYFNFLSANKISEKELLALILDKKLAAKKALKQHKI